MKESNSEKKILGKRIEAKNSIYYDRINWVFKNRLVFNTTAELEGFWGKEFSNNVIKRVFRTPQDQRRAYLDVAWVVKDQTSLDFDELMESVETASKIFIHNFERRDGKKDIAVELIRKKIYPDSWQRVRTKKRDDNILDEMEEMDTLTLTILILFLLKIFGKDRTTEKPNIVKEFDDAIELINIALSDKDLQTEVAEKGETDDNETPVKESEEENGKEGGEEEDDEGPSPEESAQKRQVIERSPLIDEALSLDESEKTRLKLIFYINEVLSTQLILSEPERNFQAIENYYDSLTDLDIEGCWEKGTNTNTSTFFQIFHTNTPGLFFLYSWHINRQDGLNAQYERYEVAISALGGNNFQFYFTKPHIYLDSVKNKPIKLDHHAYYYTKLSNLNKIGVMELRLKMLDPKKQAEMKWKAKSYTWQNQMTLRRCTLDEEHRHERDITEAENKGVCVNKFKDYEYTIDPELYNILHAITRKYLYLRTETEGEFFKIPKKSNEAFGKYDFDDITYIIKIRNKSYLGFPKVNLFISTSATNLRKWGIKRVKSIEE